jgi:Tfp pilus assembly protein PilX
MTKLAPQSTRRTAILHKQEGFTLILVLTVLLITSLLLVAAFTAANGEVHLTNTDRAQKKAYYAAEAGIEDYEYHLTQDGNYLSYCTEPKPANPALNQVGSTANKATVPTTKEGEPTNEQYAIQLLPAESDKLVADHKCDPNHLVETMVEEEGSATGTFRIESTGYSGSSESTIVATFRNANFVSYVWYTKYETGDPVIYGEPPTSPPYPTALPNYYTECANFFGLRPPQGNLSGYPLRCADNFFFGGESVNGPMHTADHAGICGSPVFGRNEDDRIEFGNGGNPEGEGYSNEGICGEASTPVFKGKHILPKEVLSIEPPPGDEELKHIVEPAYLYEEKTEIILEGSTMTVKTHVGSKVPGKEEKTTPGVAYPPNGIIYVTGGCSEAYSPFGPKPRYAGNELGAASDTTCGNVYVHGEYTKSLTISSENDVIINGNITTPVNGEGTPTTNALLGLIANNFVRVYHPVVETYEGKAPELETANHKETIKVEPKSPKLGKELEVEVKAVNASEYEVVVLKENVSTKVFEVFEKTVPLKEAKDLLTLPSPPVNVKFAKGAKYTEGEHEQLAKTVAGKWLDEKCNQYQSETEKFNSTVRMCEYTDNGLFSCDAPNSIKDLHEPTIYAAMLAVKHGVIVDNFSCGEPTLGSLKVYGAVAGLYTNGYSGADYEGKFHAYGYNANYDNRLQVEEPPHFLNPIQAAWYVQRQTLAPPNP